MTFGDLVSDVFSEMILFFMFVLTWIWEWFCRPTEYTPED